MIARLDITYSNWLARTCKKKFKTTTKRATFSLTTSIAVVSILIAVSGICLGSEILISEPRFTETPDLDLKRSELSIYKMTSSYFFGFAEMTSGSLKFIYISISVSDSQFSVNWNLSKFELTISGSLFYNTEIPIGSSGESPSNLRVLASKFDPRGKTCIGADHARITFPSRDTD